MNKKERDIPKMFLPNRWIAICDDEAWARNGVKYRKSSYEANMEDLISAQQKLFQEAKLSFDPWESREQHSDCEATSQNLAS